MLLAPCLVCMRLPYFIWGCPYVPWMFSCGLSLTEYIVDGSSVRDDTLVEAGLRLEDKPDGSSVWKLDDPEVMKAESAAKAAAATEAKLKKLRNKLDLKIREKERFEKAMASPEKYGQFDEATGDPTHLKDGTALEGKVMMILEMKM